MDAALRRVPDRLLTLGAVLGALGLLVTVVCVLAGLRPVFLRSGSMAPTMPTGSLVLARQVPAAEVGLGDVVAVRTVAGARVTHRVVGTEPAGDAVLLTLQGDANAAPDTERYRVTTAYRVVGHLPWAGYLAAAARGPGLLVCVGIAAGLVLLLVRPVRGRRSTGRRPAALLGLVAVVSVVVSVVGPGQVRPASALPWTDTAAVTGTTLTAGTVPAPASFTCGSLGLLSVRFNWAAVSGASSYTLHYGSGGSSTTTLAGTSATLTSAISGGTAWVVANRSFGSTTWTSLASETRSYTVAVVSLCS